MDSMLLIRRPFRRRSPVDYCGLESSSNRRTCGSAALAIAGTRAKRQGSFGRSRQLRMQRLHEGRSCHRPCRGSPISCLEDRLASLIAADIVAVARDDPRPSSSAGSLRAVRLLARGLSCESTQRRRVVAGPRTRNSSLRMDTPTTVAPSTVARSGGSCVPPHPRPSATRPRATRGWRDADQCPRGACGPIALPAEPHRSHPGLRASNRRRR